MDSTIGFNRNLEPVELSGKRSTNFNQGTLDPDSVIREMILELYPNESVGPYFIAERLAEAGMSELKVLYSAGQLRFSDLV